LTNSNRKNILTYFYSFKVVKIKDFAFHPVFVYDTRKEVMELKE